MWHGQQSPAREGTEQEGDTRWERDPPLVALTAHMLQSALHAIMTKAPQMDTAAVPKPQPPAEFSIWPQINLPNWHLWRQVEANSAKLGLFYKEALLIFFFYRLTLFLPAFLSLHPPSGGLNTLI